VQKLTFPRPEKAYGSQNASRRNWFRGGLQTGKDRFNGLLAGKILLEPVDVVVAVDNGGFADQRAVTTRLTAPGPKTS